MCILIVRVCLRTHSGVTPIVRGSYTYFSSYGSSPSSCHDKDVEASTGTSSANEVSMNCGNTEIHSFAYYISLNSIPDPINPSQTAKELIAAWVGSIP